MGIKIRTITLLGKGEGGRHTILHVPRSNIHKALFSLYAGLLMLNVLVDMQPLVLLKDNVQICSFKSHKLNCGYLVCLPHQLFLDIHGDIQDTMFAIVLFLCNKREIPLAL